MPELIFSLTFGIIVTGILAFVIFNHINERSKNKIDIKLTRNHKVVIFLFLSFLIIYFHPTKEVMNCVGEQNCSAEITYLDSFTIKKKVKLNSDTKLSCHIGKYSLNNMRGFKYGLYLRYDKFTPFAFYVANSKHEKPEEQKEELKQVCKVYNDKFDKYKDNYKKTAYKIESMANADKLAPNVLIIILLAYILLFFEGRKNDDWDHYKP